MNDTLKPQDSAIKLKEITDFTLASIVFSCLLNQDNINKHKEMLEQRIEKNGYTKTGQIKAAGYNPPFTIPALRMNEVFIPVKKQ